MRLKGKIGIILVTGLLFLIPARAYAAAVNDVSRELICQCGCTLVLANCSCEIPDGAAVMTASIEQQLAQGQSEKQIIQSFVAQYGSQVLVSPPNRGPSGATWSLILLALLGVGGAIYITRKKKVRRSR